MGNSEKNVSCFGDFAECDTFNLDAMAFAVNYNNEIFGVVETHINSTSRVLDFGAGIGSFANRIDFQITCVEPDSRLASRISNRHVVVSALDQGYGKYDVVYSINVLEHIEDDLEIMRQIRSRLAPGGTFIIFVPAGKDLYSIMDERAGHVRRYEKQELLDKLLSVGFKIKKSSYFDCLGYPITLATKMLGKIFGWTGALTPASVVVYDKVMFPVSNLISKYVSGSIPGKNLVVIAEAV